MNSLFFVSVEFPRQPVVKGLQIEVGNGPTWCINQPELHKALTWLKSGYLLTQADDLFLTRT